MNQLGVSDDVRVSLERQLGRPFKDRALLEQALQHRSAGSPHNERLEFLGDSIIGFHVAESLYRSLPRAREGELTRLRATIVRRESLAALARDMDLGRYLRLGPGLLKTGGRDHDSTLADALEALVGALYLDQGLEACTRWLDEILAESLACALASPPRKDHKTRLQELLQGRGEPLPVYTVIAEEGAAHELTFTVECSVEHLPEKRVASANSRRRAEQEAARLMLEVLSRG